MKISSTGFSFLPLAIEAAIVAVAAAAATFVAYFIRREPPRFKEKTLYEIESHKFPLTNRDIVTLAALVPPGNPVTIEPIVTKIPVTKRVKIKRKRQDVVTIAACVGTLAGVAYYLLHTLLGSKLKKSSS